MIMNLRDSSIPDFSDTQPPHVFGGPCELVAPPLPSGYSTLSSETVIPFEKLETGNRVNSRADNVD
jgi:hypothetical protein